MKKLSPNFESVEYYKKWLFDYSDSRSLDNDLRKMILKFIDSPIFKTINKLWLKLLCLHLERLKEHGFDNFKGFIARHYSIQTWNPESDQFKELINRVEIDIKPVDLMSFNPAFSSADAICYNLATHCLYSLVREIDKYEVLHKIADSQIGNPLAVKINDKQYSQLFLNAVLDYNSIKNVFEFHPCSTILEIGAGSGNLAFLLKSLHPEMKIILIDIPPALYIAQKYLSDSFPEEKKLCFKDFDTFQEIEKDFYSSSFIFMMPDQIEKLPEKIIDLTIAVDIFYNLRKSELNHYFGLIDALSRGLYYKTLYDSSTQNTYEDDTYEYYEYPLKKNWVNVYGRKCFYPSTHYEAFYSIK